MLDDVNAGAGTAVADAASGGGMESTTGATDGAAATEGTTEGAGAPPAEGETAEGEAEASGEEGGEDAGAEEGAEEETEIEGGLDDDGRKVDLKTREALAKLKKISPETATRLGDMYHRTQAIIKDVGAQNLSEAVNKVRQMSATLDSLGGEDGITEIQAEVGDYRKEIKQFKEGDPALMTQLHTANPKAYTVQMGNGLRILAEAGNQELLDEALFPTMYARMEKAGLVRTMGALHGLIKEGKGQEAFELTAEVLGWLAGVKSKVDKQVEMREQKNPEREELDRRKAELDQKEANSFETGIATDVNKANNVNTAKIVEPFFKELKLGNEGRREFVNALNSRIYAKMKADMAFQRAAHAIKNKGDAPRASRFISAKFAELLPDAFRELRNAMYPNFAKGGTKKSEAAGKAAAKTTPTNGAGKPAGAAAGGNPAAKLVDKLPTPDQIDWGKTTEEMYHIGRGMGEAVLKNGTRIKFDWKTVKR